MPNQSGFMVAEMAADFELNVSGVILYVASSQRAQGLLAEPSRPDASE
ncbi:MAG: hypothetical protein ACJ74J_18465 [Blastocatellia bacterium]